MIVLFFSNKSPQTQTIKHEACTDRSTKNISEEARRFTLHSSMLASCGESVNFVKHQSRSNSLPIGLYPKRTVRAVRAESKAVALALFSTSFDIRRSAAFMFVLQCFIVRVTIEATSFLSGLEKQTTRCYVSAIRTIMIDRSKELYRQWEGRIGGSWGRG